MKYLMFLLYRHSTESNDTVLTYDLPVRSLFSGLLVNLITLSFQYQASMLPVSCNFYVYLDPENLRQYLIDHLVFAGKRICIRKKYFLQSVMSE